MAMSAMDAAPYAVAGLVVLLTLWLLMGRKGSGSAAPGETFLDKKRVQVKLTQKIELSPDTRLFRFGLPRANSVFGLPVGKHIKVFCPNPDPVKEGEWNGREDSEAGKTEIERKYTPTSSDADLGYFDLVIKVYEGKTIERFPDGGKMSQYFESLSVGDAIDIQGPFGLYEYNGMGDFTVKRKPRSFTHVGMIAGGTGITPMLQVISAILRNKSDPTQVSLLFANQTEDDILVRDMLEELLELHPTRFKLHYTLDRPPTEWAHSTGFISEEMVKEHLPAPGDGTVILMCGPPPMIEYACKPNLQKVGHHKDNVIDF